MQKLFAEWLKAERPRLFLWLPVCLGAGMAAYYALPYEPSEILYAAPIALLLFLFIKRRLHPFLALTGVALLLAATGASYAKYRTTRMHVPILSAPLPIRTVEGKVDAVEHVEKGLRITLSEVHIDKLPAKETPDRVRVSYRGKTLPNLTLGERISVRAALLPPSGPAMEGAFDFSRYFFFRRIGAVGYSIPPITQLEPAETHGLMAFLNESRDALTADIQKTLPGVEGAIASGLITGDDAAIPETEHEELRAANLLHIIAISGAHMVVVGGLIFVVLRALLVLIPGVGLRPFIKSLTAFLTLVAITAYLAITGFELSATRAYVMLALMLVAIIVSREPQPMRSICLAALLMILIDPSDVIEPGFQLSFAATLALIAAFEGEFEPSLIESTRMVRIWRAICFILLTSIIAQAATTPLILFHFNNLTIYGLISNFVLTPVVTIIIMPMVALYFVLLPLGLEHISLQIMAYGIRAMMWVAHEVSTWPNALIYMRAPTSIGIIFISFGLCWLCLWRTRVRRWGVIAILLGTATLLTVRIPDILISPRAAQVAMATEKGHIVLRGRADGLFPELWANGMGVKALEEYAKVKPLEGIECGKGFCTVTRNGTDMRFSFTVPDIKLGCPDVDWWVSGFYFFPNERKECGKDVNFLDRADFDKNGGYWGWFTSEGIDWHNTREQQGERIWSRSSPAPRYGSSYASGTPADIPHKLSTSSAR